MYSRITRSGHLIAMGRRTDHDEIMILCARIDYNP